MMCEKDKRSFAINMVLVRRRDSCDAGSPDSIVPCSESSHLPPLLITQSPYSIKKMGRARSESDKDVIGEESHFVFFHVLRDLNKGKEIGGIHRSDQIAGVEDRSLDLQEFAILELCIVVINHTLDFGCLYNRIKCGRLICYLNNFSIDWVSRIGR